MNLEKRLLTTSSPSSQEGFISLSVSEEGPSLIVVDSINALGANFAVVLAPPVKKLQAQGTNDQGEEWDDGVHDNVRMMRVTYCHDCVVSVTFEYANGAETVLGDPQGILDDRHEKKEVSVLVSKLIALYIYDACRLVLLSTVDN